MKIVLLIVVLAAMAGLYFTADEARVSTPTHTAPVANQGAF